MSERDILIAFWLGGIALASGTLGFALAIIVGASS